MYILPAPPYPNAPEPSGITTARAWFLHGVAGFTKAQIEVLTAEPFRSEIERCIFRSRTLKRDELEEYSRGPTTVGRIMHELGLPPPRSPETGKILHGRAALRRALREAFVAGRVSWAQVDALRLPQEILGYEREARARGISPSHDLDAHLAHEQPTSALS
jgi:hypothetical protein